MSGSNSSNSGTGGSGGGLFLGIELAVDQLRASIVDEGLDLVGVECVDFDTELPEYKTQGGIFTTPGEAYTTPVEMWVKAIDLLLQKLHVAYPLSQIRAVGGCAQHAVVWWKSTTVPSFSSLDPHLPFHHHFPSHVFSLPNVAVAQDTSSHHHAMAIETLLGGPDHMAARVGLCGDSSLLAAQLLRVREIWPSEVWNRTGRIQLACNFLGTLLMGKWMTMSETEAGATGMWNHRPQQGVEVGGPQIPGGWDEGVLDIVGGSREEGRRVRGWLGEVDTTGSGRKAGNVSRYLVERYGFDPDAVVTQFTTDSISSYLSLVPAQNDAVLAFGPMDQLLTPAQHWLPTRLYTLHPHPAQDPSEKRRYIAALTSRNADVPRALVRDMYTKSWSAFDRLVAIVPPGGSIGLDDKLFSFWHLQSSAYPFSHVKGIYRFENGIKVNEFRDLRANPRCLIESQVLSFRVRWSRMVGTGVLGTPVSHGNGPPSPLSTGMSGTSSGSPTSTPHPHQSPSQISSSLGLSFNPYASTSPPMPSRLISTGAAANFPSVAALLADVWCCGVYVPGTQLDSALSGTSSGSEGLASPTTGGGAHRNAPAEGFPSRAALGGSYLARWIWAREMVAPSPPSGRGGRMSPLPPIPNASGTFEEETRKVMRTRWFSTGGLPSRTGVKRAGSSILSAALSAASPTTPGGNGGGLSSGRNTPGTGRSGLGHEVLVEEDEEDDQGPVVSDLSNVSIPVLPGGGLRVPSTGPPGIPSPSLGGVNGRTPPITLPLIADMSLGPTPLTAYPTSSSALNLSGNSANMSSSNSTSTSPTPAQSVQQNGGSAPLLPASPLRTSESDVLTGLVKVGEADLDGFLSYAAIVPEYCRLEAMLVKGVVL